MTTDTLFPQPAAYDALSARRADTPLPAGATPEQAQHAAEDFEAFFLARMFDLLQADLSVDAPFGGGQGEQVWRSFLSDAYAESVVAQGGVGLSDRLRSELIALQSQDQE